MFLNNPATGLPSSLAADGSGNLSFSARWIQSTNGAASAPPMALTGTWFTGGTSTTTKPQLLIEPAGTTSTNWSTAGTGLGVNAPSGFTGDLAWFGVGGGNLARINASGTMTFAPRAIGNYLDFGNGTGINSQGGGVWLGISAGKVLFNGIVAAAGLEIQGANGTIGYTAGAAVTQATSRTTGVTVNRGSGAITLVSAAGSTGWTSFTVSNSLVAATDVIKVCQRSGNNLYQIFVSQVNAGSFVVTFATTGGTTTEQPVFTFAIIKAAES